MPASNPGSSTVQDSLKIKKVSVLVSSLCHRTNLFLIVDLVSWGVVHFQSTRGLHSSPVATTMASSAPADGLSNPAGATAATAAATSVETSGAVTAAVATFTAAARRKSDCAFCMQPLDDRAGAGKLLRCLHLVCMDCLSEHSHPDSTIQCGTCSEITEFPFLRPSLLPAASLLTAASTLYRGGSGKPVFLACDDCDVDVDRVHAASHYCSNCALHLCQTCVEAHGKRRSTRNHQLIHLKTSSGGGDGDSADDGESSGILTLCPIHGKFKLTCYCAKCNAVFCEKCSASGAHPVDDGHTQLSVLTVAKTCRTQAIQALTEDSPGSSTSSSSSMSSGLASLVREALDEVRLTTVEVDEQAATVSDEICTFFADLIKTLKERQELILRDLDTLRGGVCDNLQKKKNFLQMHANCLGCVKSLQVSLAQQHVPCQDVITVSTWMGQCCDEVGKAMQTYTPPSVDGVAMLKFEPTRISEFSFALADLGRAALDTVVTDSPSDVSVATAVDEADAREPPLEATLHPAATTSGTTTTTAGATTTTAGAVDSMTASSQLVSADLSTSEVSVGPATLTATTMVAAQLETPTEAMAAATSVAALCTSVGSSIQFSRSLSYPRDIVFSENMTIASPACDEKVHVVVCQPLVHTSLNCRLKFSGIRQHPSNYVYVGVLAEEELEQARDLSRCPEQCSCFTSHPDKPTFGEARIVKQFYAGWNDGDVLQVTMHNVDQSLRVVNLSRNGDEGYMTHAWMQGSAARLFVALYRRGHSVEVL
eukprot:scpid83011/ scgid21353/ 